MAHYDITLEERDMTGQWSRNLRSGQAENVGDFRAASMTEGPRRGDEGHGRGRAVGEREREGGQDIKFGEKEAWERTNGRRCMLGWQLQLAWQSVHF